MIYTTLIKKAISFSTQVHETDQKQKRKGKDIAYIVHPLNVGLILARAGASEEIIVAGILHDTLEDSIAEKKITKEMLVEEFNEEIANLVVSVTEQNKELPWEVRKQESLEHIKSFSQGSLLVKSADILNNASELLEDYEKNGETIFERFNAPKEKILEHYLRVITAILDCWPDTPLSNDLVNIFSALEKMAKNKTAILEQKSELLRKVRLSPRQKKEVDLMMGESIKSLNSTDPLFIAFIKNEKDCSYEVHLVNPTDRNYRRVSALTGAYCGDEDGILETSKVTKEHGELSQHSSLLLERSDLDGLDFVIWFHLDLYEVDGESEPTRVWFQLPKYGWRYLPTHLSVLEKEGMVIELANRDDGETIEDEIKHLDMKGGYHRQA